MSRRNTLDQKRIRRIARRDRKENSLKRVNDKLDAAFRKKNPDGVEVMTKIGPVHLRLQDIGRPTSPVMVKKSDVRRHVYLREHGLPHSERVAALGHVIAA